MKNKSADNNYLCPCGSGKSYSLCCQPYVEQRVDAPTAEALMRSRYTAYVLHEENYLRYSWHPQTCPSNLALDEHTRWLGLRIKNSEGGYIDDEIGYVEFVARYKIDGKASRIHEISRFTRYANRWVYLDGKHQDITA